MTDTRCDLLIVGAGPAGMAAACEARERGLSVIVADEGHAPGGQIYRDVSTSPLRSIAALGKDYAAGRPLIEHFFACGAQYLPHTLVWQIGREERTGATEAVAMLTRGNAADAGNAHGLDHASGTLAVHARAVLLATGAQERPWPIRGWTLPGVMGVGAAQTALKSAGLVPCAQTVLVGSGPLLWLFGSQLLEAGRRIAAIVDTTPPDAHTKALRHLPRALRAADYLLKGWRMMRAVRRAGIAIHHHALDVEIIGDTRAGAVRFVDGAGNARQIEASLMLLHQGVIPSTNLARATGCAHEWDARTACWHPQTDAWGRSSVADVWIAGDGAGIGGAQAAAFAGTLAALDVAAQLGALDTLTRDRASRAPRAALNHHLAVRPLLDALYTPPPASRLPTDEVIVCRCEEVTAGEIRRIAARGCTGPNQMKAFSRCGMGPCQGRLCGTTVGELIAHAQARDPADVGYYRIRAPVKPVTIAQLAQAMPVDTDVARGEFPS
ncbi:FAD/NAD(P)-dependent oxidoreductase [Paraburkholderia diazotrophica]|uniref:Thioredoxin reductase n=1 Tax=Paraburkholderia diazotrophica TaxID=667676 RepID=A0A1H7E353_9BURK|nr:NAD(P)/FAD-dependent oxidoreductase [Paraburkholderia diazotrophica]SEK06000.1 Thioredoxin reductase [Paraburkholderia diazotrophica]